MLTPARQRLHRASVRGPCSNTRQPDYFKPRCDPCSAFRFSSSCEASVKVKPKKPLQKFGDMLIEDFATGKTSAVRVSWP